MLFVASMLFVSRMFVAMALFLCAASPQLYAQKRIEAGIFVDYLAVSQTSTSNFGLGGRFGYRVHHRIMLEGELAYDYGINFNEAFRNVSTGNIAAIQRTSIGVTHGLLGPKLQPARELPSTEERVPRLSALRGRFRFS